VEGYFHNREIKQSLNGRRRAYVGLIEADAAAYIRRGSLHVLGSATNRAGEVIVRWGKAAAARLYTVQISDEGTTWKDIGLTGKTRMVVTGLVSGSKPLFRIAALGAAGQSGWSEPGGIYVH
jgi:hypothetical protein